MILRWLENKKRTLGYSQSALKIIAMVAMLIDHMAFVLIENGKLYGYDEVLFQNAISLPEAKPWIILCKVMRVIGRISFPIFTLLIVEGFRKTSNLFKYILRIFCCAVVSEIPFNLVTYNRFFCLDRQNVIFLYFMGLLMLLCIKHVSKFSIFLSPVIPIVFAIICRFLNIEYWIEGILLIYVFYIFRYDINVKCGLTLIILFLMTWEHYWGLGVIAVYFIYFYDGTKGYVDLKRFPYIFYPLHLLILYGIVFFSYLK